MNNAITPIRLKQWFIYFFTWIQIQCHCIWTSRWCWWVLSAGRTIQCCTLQSICLRPGSLMHYHSRKTNHQMPLVVNHGGPRVQGELSRWDSISQFIPGLDTVVGIHPLCAITYGNCAPGDYLTLFFATVVAIYCRPTCEALPWELVLWEFRRSTHLERVAAAKYFVDK